MQPAPEARPLLHIKFPLPPPCDFCATGKPLWSFCSSEDYLPCIKTLGLAPEKLRHPEGNVSAIHPPALCAVPRGASSCGPAEWCWRQPPRAPRLAGSSSAPRAAREAAASNTSFPQCSGPLSSCAPCLPGEEGRPAASPAGRLLLASYEACEHEIAIILSKVFQHMLFSGKSPPTAQCANITL